MIRGVIIVEARAILFGAGRAGTARVATTSIRRYHDFSAIM